MNTHVPPTPHPTRPVANDAISGFAGSGRRRLSVNITPLERGARIVLGLATVIVAVVLFVLSGSALAVVLEVLLIAAGLDLVITGALGHCPLYQRLGHVPVSLRGST